MKNVKFCLINDKAHMPTRATKNSAGLDLYASEPTIIKSKSWGLVKTGITMELPEGMEAQIRSRSGLAIKKGVFVLNSPGTIDADYRGEVGIILANLGNEDFTVNVGDRVAQMVIANLAPCKLVQVESENDLTTTDRGSGGFGSTGVKHS